MSRLETIKDFGRQRLEAIEGLSIKPINPGQGFLVKPDNYPGATWGLDDMDPIESRYLMASEIWTKWRVTAYVLIYGASDGLAAGDASSDAFRWVDAVIAALHGKTPTGLPADTTVEKLECGKVEPFAVLDLGSFGVAVPVTVNIAWSEPITF